MGYGITCDHYCFRGCECLYLFIFAVVQTRWWERSRCRGAAHWSWQGSSNRGRDAGVKRTSSYSSWDTSPAVHGDACRKRSTVLSVFVVILVVIVHSVYTVCRVEPTPPYVVSVFIFRFNDYEILCCRQF